MVTPIFIECCVILTLAVHRMAMGYTLAFPAALIAGLTRNNTDIYTTKDEASWIVATFNITGAMSFLILPPVMQAYGRRISNIVNNIILVCGAIVIALAPNIPWLITGQCIQGFGFCGLFLNVVIGAEYCHPRRRGFCLVLKSTGTIVGIILCHGIGFVMPWRHIAWLGTVFPAISAIGTFIWPESPSWLAYKGRYEDCIEQFKILRTDNVESKRELRQLIYAQREINKLRVKGNLIVRTIKTFGCKDFLKPLAILTVIDVMAHVCGIFYLLAYIIQIMEQLSGDSSMTFCYTMCFDAMKIFALVISSAIFRIMNIRTLLFSSASLAFLLLGLVCILDYLTFVGVLSVKWLTPIVLIVYNFVCHLGIIPIYLVAIGELFPLQYKSVGALMLGFVYSILGLITTKYTARMLESLQVHGTFAIYLSIAIICLVTLYYVMPETKNRTLQEIEMDFIDIKLEFDKENELGSETIDKLVKQQTNE